MTFAQLSALAPHIEWGKYFDEAKIPREPVNVAEPKLLQQVDKELATAPVAAWRAYLRWQLLDAASPWLSKAFAEEARAFRARLPGGAGEPAPRAQRCVESTEALLGEPVGRIFAARYFPPAAKAKAREIANGLIAVLKWDVAGLSWMTEDTRKAAIEKLDLMNIQIGYPDDWSDVSRLEIRRDTLWANIARARALHVDDARRQIGKPTDRGNWQLPPSSPDAYLDPQLDELVLPAGFLQPPYFDAAASDAVNYGAFGAGLAHDMTHAFDATGALIDAAGRAHDWWTPADHAQFHKRTQCVVDQYESYSVEPGVHHRGALVLDEALGDQAGLHIAYRAYERAMGSRPGPAIDGFTPAQQFFLAWAQFRGEAVRIEAQRQMIQTDPHAVPKFRVIGPLSNLPEFAQAFSCKAGAAMVRPPDQRCSMW
jgi:endothelin-converting enzyme/putative endopeptidase